MASSQFEEAARTLGLEGRGSTGTFFGALDGFPVQLATGLPGRTNQALALFRFNADGRAQDVAKALDESADLSIAGVVPEDLSSDEDSVVLAFPPTVLFATRKTNIVEPRVRAVLDVLKRAVPDNRKACGRCGAIGGEPALLGGEVHRLCGNCIEAFEHDAEVAENAYAAHPANLPLGVAASLLAGAAGAAFYGGVMIGTNRMFWLLATITGSCVGIAAVKGAGKATAAVQAMAAVITVISVLAGLLMFIGYQINTQAEARGGAVDWSAFLKAAPELLVAGGVSTLFSLAGGLVGAWYACRWARPPDFGMVEKAR